jgi:hypothetical protein
MSIKSRYTHSLLRKPQAAVAARQRELLRLDYAARALAVRHGLPAATASTVAELAFGRAR